MFLMLSEIETEKKANQCFYLQIKNKSLRKQLKNNVSKIDKIKPSKLEL
jgi:hypothetical protein